VALGLALVAFAPAAHAQKKKRIAVLEFSGPRASRFQSGVVKVLKRSARVISQKQFTRAARKVKGFKANAEGVSKVARRLDAHGVLTGKVTRRRGKFRLTIRMREGASGEFVGDDIVVTSRAPRLTRAHERKIARELRAILRDLPAPGEEVAEEEPFEEEPVDEVAEEEPAEEEPAEEVAEAGGGGSDDGEDGEDGEEDVSLSATQKADLAARGRAIDLTAGLSVVSRSLSFSFDPGPTTPQGYDGALVPGVYVDAEIYPMALVNDKATGVTRHIGVSLVFDKVLLIKSKPVNQDVDLPTSQTRYGAGLVYRWNFGDSPTSPTLKLGVGYNKLSFTIDESAAPEAMVDLPDVSYSYIDPSVGLRFPVTEKIAATGEARYLVVTAAGPIAEADAYGAGGASGFGFDLGGEYKLGSTLAVRAGFQFMQIGLDFDGSGAMSDRNGDMTQDVQSASDRFLGFHASLGWVY